MKTVKILDKEFYLSISRNEIQQAITNVAKQMNSDLANEDVVFIGILNGSFLFAADLYKQIEFLSKISFLKVASYEGTNTTGKVKKLIGLNEDLENKTVVVLEDIIDSGITLEAIQAQLQEYKPKQVLLATLLFKPKAFQKNYKIHYVGKEIPNEFIVGYGLDYDGFGRNLPDIYSLVK